MKAKSNIGPWRDLYNLVHKIQGLKVRTGVFGGQTPDGTELSEVAAAHEYGAEIHRTRKDGTPYTIVIPRRSYIRQTFEKKRAELITLQGKIAQLILLGKITQQKAMELLGMWAVGAIKATISSDGQFAPLKPATIKRKKGSKKPLIDSGQLFGAIAYKVGP